jgi:hypothetical protein
VCTEPCITQVAYIKGEFNEKRDTCNGYVVFESTVGLVLPLIVSTTTASAFASSCYAPVCLTHTCTEQMPPQWKAPWQGRMGAMALRSDVSVHLLINQLYGPCVRNVVHVCVGDALLFFLFVI